MVGDLIAKISLLLGQATGLHRDSLLGLVVRQPYRGEDTSSGLNTAVFLEIDDAIQAGPTGLVLRGWFLSHPDEIHEVRIRCSHLTAILEFQDCIRVRRQDVIDGFAQHGFIDPRCGFIAYLLHASRPNSRVYIEVERTGREVGFRNVPCPKLQGLTAMKRLLSAVDVRFAELEFAFDHVLGPAVPSKPRISIIVPLYRRLDYVEYQLSLLSAHDGCRDVEFIYVLDASGQQQEAELLFMSAYDRFVALFKAVILNRNVGFAPASNIGLQHTSGTIVAFVNSDVFPGTPDWLDRLANRLEKDPTIGVIGPMLLFEDQAVQHRGMFFQRLPKFGSWYFGMHHDKGCTSLARVVSRHTSALPALA